MMHIIIAGCRYFNDYSIVEKEVMNYIGPFIGKIDIEMTVENGRGYVDAKENKKRLVDAPIDTIAIDSSYSPIELVKYEVVDTRVGQNENYDKLIMEISTNGSMNPEEALALAAKISRLSQYIIVLMH